MRGTILNSLTADDILMLMETEDEVDYFVFHTVIFSLLVSDIQECGEWDCGILGQHAKP